MAPNHIDDILPTRFTVQLPGGVLAGWRWLSPEKPPLLFCHATGFCASAYKQMLQQLTGMFDVYALDMRGHGRTQLPADPRALRSWDIYAADIARFLDSEGRQNWTLAGHSMGGVTVALAARGRSDIAALRLIEPVAMPSSYALMARTPLWPIIAKRIPLVRRAAERRAAWPNRAAVTASYGRKALFRSWADGVLADYLEDGLVEGRPGDGGSVKLACDPQWEAATFAAQASDFWGAVRNAPAPITVQAAAHRSSTTPAWAERRFANASGIIERTGHVSHLLPLEQPSLAADFIAAAVKGV